MLVGHNALHVNFFSGTTMCPSVGLLVNSLLLQAFFHFSSL